MPNQNFVSVRACPFPLALIGFLDEQCREATALDLDGVRNLLPFLIALHGGLDEDAIDRLLKTVSSRMSSQTKAETPSVKSALGQLQQNLLTAKSFLALVTAHASGVVPAHLQSIAGTLATQRANIGEQAHSIRALASRAMFVANVEMQEADDAAEFDRKQRHAI